MYQVLWTMNGRTEQWRFDSAEAAHNRFSELVAELKPGAEVTMQQTITIARASKPALTDEVEAG